MNKAISKKIIHLLDDENLQDLDKDFLLFLPTTLSSKLRVMRDTPDSCDGSDVIIEIAPYLENFLAKFLDIEDAIKLVQQEAENSNIVSLCKRNFIIRKVSKNTKSYQAYDIEKTKKSLLGFGLYDTQNELEFAKLCLSQNDELLDLLMHYATWALFNEEGKKLHSNSVLFKLPEKTDYDHLTSFQKENGVLLQKDTVGRKGFACTDPGKPKHYTLAHANYCIYCHPRKKDSCSRGMEDSSGGFKENELKNKLYGCPLEEKISEMNCLRAKGYIIGAFATALINNPMICGTGHRICNDCTKACIYQKQEPVDIPWVETDILRSVLKLDWGFEIYYLLIRWNPLNFAHFLPRKKKAHKLLIVGTGPAGFTLAHYMLNEGFIVTCIDAAKIEPLQIDYKKPIKDILPIIDKDQSDRVAGGFGGVMEYGITARWNKNNLELIRALLQRRVNFALYGGINFGGNLTLNLANKLGFDHIALATGAGSPNIINIEGMMSRGVRMASDFLMSLQLTGAMRKSSFANLQIKMPIVVIGGGLTAIDTATESLEYYATQVLKFLDRYEILGDQIFDKMTSEEKKTALEFIEHGKIIKAAPNKKTEILRSLGGVTILYRKKITDSPAYRLNHEEVNHALAEGIFFKEMFSPKKIITDKQDNCIAVEGVCGKTIPAASIMIAIGTSPNTMAADNKNIIVQGHYFQMVDNYNNIICDTELGNPKAKDVSFLTSVSPSGVKGISFFGDLHPAYFGNVVRAMASAMRGYPKISSYITKHKPQNKCSNAEFFKTLDDHFIATIKEINNLAPNILEIVIKAKSCAAEFAPGRFYKFQNYERVDGFGMEALAMTGAWVDQEQGSLAIIILKIGTSTLMCQNLKIGQQVVLMGPAGAETLIPKNEDVLLVGGGLGNAVLFSIGAKMRQNGCRVIYFAGYRDASLVFKKEKIEQSADLVIWCCENQLISTKRERDFTFKGNVIDGIKQYLGQDNQAFDFNKIKRSVVIGSDKMMQSFSLEVENGFLKNLLPKNHTVIASINSPMQCMAKGICAQCIQRHVDKKTQEVRYVYSCVNQDQIASGVDFNNLHSRLTQNIIQEKVTNLMYEKKYCQDQK